MLRFINSLNLAKLFVQVNLLNCCLIIFIFRYYSVKCSIFYHFCDFSVYIDVRKHAAAVFSLPVKYFIFKIDKLVRPVSVLSLHNKHLLLTFLQLLNFIENVVEKEKIYLQSYSQNCHQQVTSFKITTSSAVCHMYVPVPSNKTKKIKRL